ncbi:MAG: nucleotidyltransferase [Nitrospirae bacterium]|nr:nucleotidyltransferase [Nitrospirota bacterium]
MAPQDAQRPQTRPPTLEDLVAVCKHLNEHGVRYLLIGGFAVNYYGFPRVTEDIDLLVDPSDENVSKIKEALAFLPDNAVREVAPDDVGRYEVVRVADEIVIDLMKRACDVTYDRAGIEHFLFHDVRIPIADLPTLIKTKQGVRPQDQSDLAFLRSLAEEEKS